MAAAASRESSDSIEVEGKARLAEPDRPMAWLRPPSPVVSAPPPNRRGHGLVLIVVALGAGLRFLRLDADPHYYDWIGYITDEGRWIDQARELALFGSSDVRPSLHVLVGPLFQAVSYGVFRVFDVSISSSRLISAVSGSVLLAAFWLGVRRLASAPMLLVPMVMLAFAEDLILLSRIAIPEMAVMVADLFIYLMIISDRRRSLLLVLAGAASLITVGIKITSLPVVGIFALLVLIQPRDPSWAQSRWRDLTLFLAGLLSPVAGVAALLAAYGPAVDGLLARAVRLVDRFGVPSSLYSALAFVFDDPMAREINLWLLALWCALAGWRAAGNLVDVVSRRVLMTSMTWAGVYAVVMLCLDYYPNRYKAHILVPMAVASAVGLSLLQRAGRARVNALGAEEIGARRSHGGFSGAAHRRRDRSPRRRGGGASRQRPRAPADQDGVHSVRGDLDRSRPRHAR
jgi:predicted membrane-bound mannosyltransferase